MFVFCQVNQSDGIWKNSVQSDGYELSRKTKRPQQIHILLRVGIFFNDIKDFNSKMAIFEIIQNRYAILGISSSHHLSQNCPLSKRVLYVFLILGCVIVLHFVHIFRVADEFMEYVESICTTSGSIIVFVCLAIITRKNTTFIEIFNSVESILIDTSKSILYFIWESPFENWNLIHSGMWMSRITQIFVGKNPTRGTNQWIHLHTGSENLYAIYAATQVYRQFWRLLHHRFGIWLVSIAISVMVNLHTFISNNKQNALQWNNSSLSGCQKVSIRLA